MGNVARWISRDISEKVVAETCIKILEKNNLPTDGKATNAQFADVSSWVSSQIEDSVDPADFITT